MDWRSLFSVDLSGKLSTWKRRYKGDYRTFDFRTVQCVVTDWRGGRRFSVSASAYCSDPSVTGFDVRPFVSFYHAPDFHSRIEAEAHVEAEVRKATRKHPNTRFYRARNCLILEDGRVAEQPIVYYEYCLAGKWHHAERIPSGLICEACGHQIDNTDVCPKCGQPVWPSYL